MTQTPELKDKLLKYLCMALPYEVIIKVTDVDGFTYDGILQVVSKGKLGNGWFRLDILDSTKKAQVKNTNVPLNYIYFKPYLRPMSSMTEEESNEWAQVESDEYGVNDIIWLLEHHFDFMGLIPIGAAIDCTGLDIYKD